MQRKSVAGAQFQRVVRPVASAENAACGPAAAIGRSTRHAADARGAENRAAALIGLILVVYVLLIQRTDRLVRAGAIRRRKWTWFTFPFVTVALTLVAGLAGRMVYTRFQTVPRWLRFDVEPKTRSPAAIGSVLFQGSERNVTTKTEPQNLLRHDAAAFQSRDGIQAISGARMGSISIAKTGYLRKYLGRVRPAYSVTRILSQWTPAARSAFCTILHANEKSIEFDWNKYTDAPCIARRR